MWRYGLVTGGMGPAAGYDELAIGLVGTVLLLRHRQVAGSLATANDLRRAKR